MFDQLTRSSCHHSMIEFTYIHEQVVQMKYVQKTLRSTQRRRRRRSTASVVVACELSKARQSSFCKHTLPSKGLSFVQLRFLNLTSFANRGEGAMHSNQFSSSPLPGPAPLDRPPVALSLLPPTNAAGSSPCRRGTRWRST